MFNGSWEWDHDAVSKLRVSVTLWRGATNYKNGHLHFLFEQTQIEAVLYVRLKTRV